MNLLNKFRNREIELYGEKDIYSYFNLINEKFESKIFSSSDLEGTILSTEPLTYKLRSNSFPNNSPQIPEVWKTSIIVAIQKKGTGTMFSILPKTGIHTLIIYAFVLLIFVVNLINDTLFKQPSNIIAPVIVFAIFYLLDKFAKKRLINEFKEQVL